MDCSPWVDVGSLRPVFGHGEDGALLAHDVITVLAAKDVEPLDEVDQETEAGHGAVDPFSTAGFISRHQLSLGDGSTPLHKSQKKSSLAFRGGQYL